MSKKTRFTLGRIAIAAALFTTSSLASAATCSTSYCFVDGKMKWVTSEEIASAFLSYSISITTPADGNSSIKNFEKFDEGDDIIYYRQTIQSPVSDVKFISASRLISSTLNGSSIMFTKGSRTVSMKNLSFTLAGAPSIISIYSDFQSHSAQGFSPLKARYKTFWNLDGSGNNASRGGIGYTVGNGSISSLPEADGYHHARVSIPSIGLIGSASDQPPYCTDSLMDFTYGIWNRIGYIYCLTHDSVSFGSIELDMRFSPTKP